MTFLYVGVVDRLDFQWPVAHPVQAVAALTALRDSAMSILEHHHQVSAIHDRVIPDCLHDATCPSEALFADIIATSCHRIFALRHTSQAVTLAKLIDAGAWTDAALTLIALELPQWRLRRLAYDEGEWHCALSSNREMPDWLDASVETHHADMALAILAAFLEARQARRTPEPSRASVSQDNFYEPVSSDHFA